MMTMGGSYIEQEEGGFRHSYRGYTLDYLKKRYKDSPKRTRNSIDSHIEDGRLKTQLEALYTFLNSHSGRSRAKFFSDFPQQKNWYYFYCKVFKKPRKTGRKSRYLELRDILLNSKYPKVYGQERIDLKKKLNPAGGWEMVDLYNYLDKTHNLVWHFDPDEKKLFYKKNPKLESAVRVYAISDGRI